MNRIIGFRSAFEVFVTPRPRTYVSASLAFPDCHPGRFKHRLIDSVQDKIRERDWKNEVFFFATEERIVF